MREQPWRRFVLLFSIANFKLRAHYLDRSGMIISAPMPIGRHAVRFADVLNAMTLGNHSALGLDPTIHVCDEGEVYWIMAILWKSRGLFSRGTVCYRVQDKDGQEYALKDCWVDADKLEQEVDFLRAVDGVPNVVRLRKYWDVKYDGRVDSTSHIRD
ncbi:hypothetical protein P692DRAFT_201727111, partial [Suillus brevipes Sb2]